MDKKISFALSFLLSASVLFLVIFGIASPGGPAPEPYISPTPTAAAPAPSPSPEPLAEFRGVWAASVANLDYPSKTGLSADHLRAEADQLLDTARELGFTAVFLQVRPAGDALYPSEIFPWSRYLTGRQGEAPPGGFDPLRYFIDGAHARGLELHAWLNLLRVARNEAELQSLSPDNPASGRPEWLLQAGALTLYDPGIPEVRALLLDGVRELCQGYDLDGIHYDDYFYPEGGADDAASYAAHGSGGPDDWRRGNINALIRETQEIAHSAGVRFGVSPPGVWQNLRDDPRGSETEGSPSYSAQFADSLLWVTEGWVDYIAPQLYWEIGDPKTDYQILLDWWASAVRETGTDLYIGQATYLSSGAPGLEAWGGTAEIIRQIERNRACPEVKGSLHFRYARIAGNQELRQAVRVLHGIS